MWLKNFVWNTFYHVKVLFKRFQEKNFTQNNNEHEMPEAISPKCKWWIGFKKGVSTYQI
jgi:hypothetical protein